MRRGRKKTLLSKACCSFYLNCCQIIVTLQSRLEISLTVATGIENHFKFVPDDLLFIPKPFLCFFSHRVLIPTFQREKTRQTKNCNQCEQWSAGKRIIYGLISAPPCRRWPESMLAQAISASVQRADQCNHIQQVLKEVKSNVSLKPLRPVILRHGCLVSDGRHVDVSLADVR